MQARLLEVDTALLSSHTVVRRFREGDGEVLYNLVQDNYNRLYDDFPSLIQAISSKEEGEFFVRRRLADWQLQRGYCFGIWHNKENELIGMLYFKAIDWAVPKAAVCFFIDRAHSERGLMTESMLAGLDFVFRQLEIEKLELRTSMENVAAQRLARKCDFRREGELGGGDPEKRTSVCGKESKKKPEPALNPGRDLFSQGRKMVELRGVEPLTFALRTRRSTR